MTPEEAARIVEESENEDFAFVEDDMKTLASEVGCAWGDRTLELSAALATLVLHGRETGGFNRALECRSSWGGRHGETEDEWNEDLRTLRALDGNLASHVEAP